MKEKLHLTKSFLTTKLLKLVTIQALLWWLIICVNLIGLKDAQRDGKPLVLDLSTGTFPEENSIRIHYLSKSSSPPPCEWALSKLLRAQIEQKRKRMGDFALSA